MDTQPPIPPSDMSPDLREFLLTLRTDVKEVRIAIKGDEMGNHGIVKTIDGIREDMADMSDKLSKHEREDEKQFAVLDKKIVFIFGVGTAIVSAFEAYHVFSGK